MTGSDERGLGEHLGPALDLILRDLVDLSPLRVEPSDWQTWPGAESAMIRARDGSGMGVWLDPTLPPAEQVVMLADQVQEWAVEELCAQRQPTNWPQCPEHPDNHPLEARLTDEVATWCCPRSGRAVVEIGRFRTPPS